MAHLMAMIAGRSTLFKVSSVKNIKIELMDETKEEIKEKSHLTWMK